jgi:hypothetical protein
MVHGYVPPPIRVPLKGFNTCGVCNETFTVQGMPAHMYLKHGIRYPRYKPKKKSSPEKMVRIYITAEIRDALRVRKTRENDTYDKVLLNVLNRSGG